MSALRPNPCDQEKIVNNVLIVIAMAAEAEPLLQRLGLSPTPCAFPNAPCTIYSGCYKGACISVVTNGKCNRFGVDNVGTVPAALATFLAVNQLKPDLVINAGTAGGFKRKGAAIGDAFICSLMRNHDRRIPIPGFTEYGLGHHVAHPCPNTTAALGVKSGVVSTGNSLDCTDTDDKHMEENDASVKDMEAAAIAWCTELTGTPFVALKVVTDIVDGGRPTQEEFMENLATAAASLQTNIFKMLDFIIGRKLNDL